MQRVAFKRKAPPRPPRAPLVPRAEPARAVMTKVDPAAKPLQVRKTPDRVDQRIRESARGEACTVRIVGACSFDPAKTIWSHAPLQAAGKGRGIKAIDPAGAYACTCCDAVVDGQVPLPPGATRDSVLLDWFMGHMRSLVILRQKGLV